MENTYGIGVKNRYQWFLDNEDDTLEVSNLHEKIVRKNVKSSEKENKGKLEAKRKSQSVTRKSVKETKNLKSLDMEKPEEDWDTAKSTKQDDNHANTNFGDNHEEESNNWEDNPVGDYTREDKNNLIPLSTDDSGNWDSETIDADVDANPLVEHTKNDTEMVKTKIENEEIAPHIAEEEEQKVMTLDEYRALKGTRQKPQYNLRKAGEGEDLSQWKKIYALQKKKEENEVNEEEEEYDRSDYPQRVGRQKHLLGIEIHFADNARSFGRGRGGRGMGRGGTRFGSPKSLPITSGMFPHNQVSQNFRQTAPKVDDEHDFPSLG